MSILAPLFLLGVFVIALPVWLHRLQTQSPERQPFSSTMLLEQSQQRTHLRKKLRYLALLSLRILLLLLLVLAFSKPVWERPARFLAGDDAVLHLLVIDRSFSMGYGTAMDTAKAEAREVIAQMADGDIAQIIFASNSIEVPSPPDNNRAELNRIINSVQVDSGRLDFGVMISQLNGLIREYQQNTRIHLISDFQNSGLAARFADLIPAAAGSYVSGLELYPVVSADNANLYIDSIIKTETGLNVGVRGHNNDAAQVRVVLKINDALHGEQTGLLAADGQHVFEFAVANYESGDNRIEAVLLNEDDLAADNIRYAVVDNTPPKPVLLLTTNTQALPVRYLTAAVEAAQQGYRVEAVAINEIDPRIIQRYAWLIIDDLGIINESLAAMLLEYLDNGGAVLAAVGERAQTRQTLPVVGYAVNPLVLSSAILSPHSVARIDASHPALAGTSGWRDIYVSRLLALETGTATRDLINLDNGAPLLLEHQHGRGRLLLLTSSLDNSWNDIPIRPVFVNFIAEAARYLTGSEQLKRQQTAGEYLQLSQTGTVAGQVVDPDGRTVLSLADTHRSLDIKLNQTGFYQIYTVDSEALVAVNPDLRESDLTRMSAEAMARWKEAVSGAQAPTGTAQVQIEQEPIELWHILLILLGMVILAESILGNRHLASGRGYL
jgi:hypothetical protein